MIKHIINAALLFTRANISVLPTRVGIDYRSFCNPGVTFSYNSICMSEKRTHHAVRNTLTLFSDCNMLVICLYLPCMPFQLIKGITIPPNTKALYEEDGWAFYPVTGITIPPNTKALYEPLKATFDRCILYLCFVSLFCPIITEKLSHKLPVSARVGCLCLTGINYTLQPKRRIQGIYGCFVREI